MRVGLYGNDNNVSLLLAEGLRTLGHRPRLVVTRRETLHRPEGVHPTFAAGYPDWIFDASGFDDTDYACLNPKLTNAINFVGDCDLLILNHVGPSLAAIWGRPYVCLLTGSDLNYYGGYGTLRTIATGWDPVYLRSAGGRLFQRTWSEFIGRQRAGIAGARRVIHPQRGLVPDGDRLLDELGVGDHQRAFFILAFGQWLPEPVPRGDGALRILCGSRTNWREPFPPGTVMQDNKGTDVLVRGLAAFVREVPEARVELRLIEKGLHVEETRALVADLGLADRVRWQPDLPLRAFLGEVAAADIVVDHFGPAVPGLCAWNGMAAGKPVLGNLCLDALEPHFGEPVPACHAATSDRVADWLVRLWREPELREDLGTRARAFAGRHLDVVPQLRTLLGA